MADWVSEENGWHVDFDLGGICLEQRGWYWWPKNRDWPIVGPFKALKDAKKYAEEVPRAILEQLEG